MFKAILDHIPVCSRIHRGRKPNRRLLFIPRCEAIEPRCLLAAASETAADLLPDQASDVVTAQQIGEALLRIRLEASQTVGGPALSGSVDRSSDATFFVNVYVEDTRDVPQGVVGGALDVSWAPDLVTASAGLQFGGPFELFQQGQVDNANDSVDEAGALSSTLGVGADGEALFLAFEVTAVANGEVSFAGLPGNGTATITPANFALLDRATAVPWEDVEFAGTTVSIISQLGATLSVNSVAHPEGNPGVTTPFTFEVSLSEPSDDVVTVQFDTADGTATAADNDYTPVTGRIVTFDPGQTRQEVIVDVVGDDRVEGSETFSVRLSNPSGATLETETGTGTIENDDTGPAVDIGDVSQLEGSSGDTTPFVFQLSLSAPSSQSVTVQVDTQDGSATAADNDYTPLASQLVTFAPGATMQTVTVQVTADDMIEADETFTVRLSNPVGATLSRQSGTGTIRNDDDGANASLSGIVYADTNSSGQRDALEVGLPGVIITVTGTDDEGNPVELSSLTGDDGSFEFMGLRAGTYEIAQAQPAAFLDGQERIGTAGGTASNDRFSEIVLSSNQSSMDNLFGEAGLRPQFISRRMFLASTPPIHEVLRELIARGEELAGNAELARRIRAAGDSTTALASTVRAAAARAIPRAPLSGAVIIGADAHRWRSPHSSVQSAGGAEPLKNVLPSRRSNTSLTTTVTDAVFENEDRWTNSVATSGGQFVGPIIPSWSTGKRLSSLKSLD